MLPKLWGGKRIYALLNMPEGILPIGESWLLSPLQEHTSVVEEGEFKGMNINQMMQKYGDEILGPTLNKLYNKKFPLLLKIIDATEDLSVQVHPGKNHPPLPNGKRNWLTKNELWYILDAKPEAEIILGLDRNLSAHELVEYAINGNLFEVVRRLNVKNGEIYDIPAGTIHAIRNGNLLIEIQQPVDITYRLWDYDRVEKESGKKRQLHLSEAVDAAIMTRSTTHNRPYRAIPNEQTRLIEKPFANIDLLWVSSQKLEFKSDFSESFAIVMGIAGEATVIDRYGHKTPIQMGKSLLIPSSVMPISVENETGEGKLLIITHPDPNSSDT